MNTLPPIAEMERAYLERDRRVQRAVLPGRADDGHLLPADLPGAEAAAEECGVFSDGARRLLLAGYRPCKRCRPLEADDQPDWAAALLADVERDPRRASPRRSEGARHRSGDGAAAFPPPLWHDVSGVCPRRGGWPARSRRFARARGSTTRSSRAATSRTAASATRSRKTFGCPPGESSRQELRAAVVAAQPARSAGGRGDRRRASACWSSPTGGCWRRSSRRCGSCSACRWSLARNEHLETLQDELAALLRRHAADVHGAAGVIPARRSSGRCGSNCCDSVWRDALVSGAGRRRRQRRTPCAPWAAPTASTASRS